MGLGSNAKIFKNYFLELSNILVAKNMFHTSELFIFLLTCSGTLRVVHVFKKLCFISLICFLSGRVIEDAEEKQAVLLKEKSKSI